MFSFATSVFKNVVSSKLNGNLPLDKVAFKQVEIHPETSERVRPAIILDGAFDRVTNVGSEYFPTDSLKILNGETVTHQSTKAFQLRNIKLFAGSIYTKNYRIRVKPPELSGIKQLPNKFDNLSLCTDYSGSRYFGHFLRDDLPKVLLAQEFSPPMRLPGPDWEHLPIYRENMSLDWSDVSIASIDTLTIFRDLGMNANLKSRVFTLRDRLREKVTPRKNGSRYYLRRGKTGVNRAPDNDNEICLALAARGYDIIDLETTNPSRFLNEILEREIVVSVEGSGVMHSLYTAPVGGGALVIFPPDRACMANKSVFDLLEGHFAITVGHKTETGYRVCIAELEKTLDQLEQTVSSLTEV